MFPPGIIATPAEYPILYIPARPTPAGDFPSVSTVTQSGRSFMKSGMNHCIPPEIHTTGLCAQDVGQSFLIIPRSLRISQLSEKLALAADEITSRNQHQFSC